MLDKMVLDVNYAMAITDINRAIESLEFIGKMDKASALTEIRDALKKERGELNLYK